MSENAGASVGTQTRCARSQPAPAEQSASVEQLPRLEMRQAVSARRRRTVDVARMGSEGEGESGARGDENPRGDEERVGGVPGGVPRTQLVEPGRCIGVAIRAVRRFLIVQIGPALR